MFNAYPPSRHNSSEVAAGCIIAIVCFVIYLLVFWWFSKHGIARPYPTGRTNFWWGLLQGVFIAPSFIVSLLDPHHYAIYQTPNNGGWYNFGFVLGSGALFGGSSRSS